MANLAHYLTAIGQGKPINYPLLLKLLPKDIGVDHHHLFETTKVSLNRYQVKVIDQALFNQLVAEHTQVVTNRVDAAMAGDSHQVATSYGFLLVYHQQLSSDRPDVVVTGKQGFSQGFSPKGTLLIIENQENFFLFNRLLGIFGDFYGQPLGLSDCDIVYGAGNQINKALNFSFFEQYHTLLCAFDYDFGGLSMFKRLKQQVSGDVQLLQPDDFTPWHHGFRRQPNDQQIWRDAVVLAKSLGFDALAQTMTKTRAFMEQEVFLAD